MNVKDCDKIKSHKREESQRAGRGKESQQHDRRPETKQNFSNVSVQIDAMLLMIYYKNVNLNMTKTEWIIKDSCYKSSIMYRAYHLLLLMLQMQLKNEPNGCVHVTFGPQCSLLLYIKGVD